MSTPSSSLPPVLFPLPSGPLSEVIAEVLRPGLQALHLQDPVGHGLLAPWAEPILERMAWKAWTKGKDPDWDVGSAEPFVEAELKRQSKSGALGGPAGRRQLMALLAHVDRLLRQNGWFAEGLPRVFVTQSESPLLGFSCTWLPSLLVGKRILTEPSEATELRAALGANPSWALAGWAAVRHGDSAELWIDLLLQETDPVQWLARVVPTACVLAAVEPGMVPEAKFLLAYQECVRGLCWFPPRHMQEYYDAHPDNEPATGWQLPRTPWLQAVMALAGLQEVQQSWTAALQEGFWQQPPSLLAPLVSLLGVAGPQVRPLALEPKTVAALLLPHKALVEGLWDREFWEQLHGSHVSSRLVRMLRGVHGDGDDLGDSWRLKACLPALVAASVSSVQALRLLTLPSERGPWFSLVADPALTPLWRDAWVRLLKPTDSLTQDAPVPTVPELMAAWVEGMSRLASRGWDPSEDQSQVQPLQALIEARGLWSEAQAALRQMLIKQSPWLPAEPSPVRFAAARQLFMWAELTESDWEQLLRQPHRDDAQFDRLFRAAWAPEALLAIRFAQTLQKVQQQGDSPLAAEVALRVRDVLQGESIVAIEAVLGVLAKAPNGPLGRSVVTWSSGLWLHKLIGHQGSALQDLAQVWLMHLAKWSQDRLVRSRAVQALMKQQGLASGGTP